MAISKTYRWVLVCELLLRKDKRTVGHVEFQLEDFINAVKLLHSNDDTVYSFAGERKRLRIADIDDNSDFFSMLISMVDKDATDTVYEDFDTYERRVFERGENDGSVSTSHVLIARDIVNNNHRFLVERVPHINIGLLEGYFNKLMDNPLFQKDYSDPTDGSSKKCSMKAEIRGNQSATLRDAIKTGRLKDIEFSGIEEIDQGFDEATYIKENIRAIKIKVDKTATVDAAESILEYAKRRFLEWRQTDNDQLLVRIKTGIGQEKQVSVDIDSLDIMQNYFVQNEKISNFDADLRAAEDSIRNDIIVKMKNLACRTSQ